MASSGEKAGPAAATAAISSGGATGAREATTVPALRRTGRADEFITMYATGSAERAVAEKTPDVPCSVRADGGKDDMAKYEPDAGARTRT